MVDNFFNSNFKELLYPLTIFHITRSVNSYWSRQRYILLYIVTRTNCWVYLSDIEVYYCAYLYRFCLHHDLFNVWKVGLGFESRMTSAVKPIAQSLLLSTFWIPSFSKTIFHILSMPCKDFLYRKDGVGQRSIRPLSRGRVTRSIIDRLKFLLFLLLFRRMLLSR